MPSRTCPVPATRGRRVAMARRMRPMASIHQSWYGVILAAILAILQFIYQEGESHLHMQRKISLCASMSLITVTSFKRLPSSSDVVKISLFFVILACTSFLSATVPSKLWWVPHVSCVRPLFELLHKLYLFCTNMSIVQFWEFCSSIVNAVDQCKRRAREIIQRFVPTNVGHSSSAQAKANEV